MSHKRRFPLCLEPPQCQRRLEWGGGYCRSINKIAITAVATGSLDKWENKSSFLKI